MRALFYFARCYKFKTKNFLKNALLCDLAYIDFNCIIHCTKKVKYGSNLAARPSTGCDAIANRATAGDTCYCGFKLFQKKIEKNMIFFEI